MEEGIFIWADGDFEFPDGTVEGTPIDGIPTVTIAAAFGNKPTFLMDGWSPVDGSQSVQWEMAFNGQYEVENTRGKRPLRSSELEALLGTKPELTNFVSKVPGEKLPQREERRNALLYRATPLNLWRFAVNSVVGSTNIKTQHMPIHVPPTLQQVWTN